MGNFLRFDAMITPVLIQIVFWLAVIACIVIGIAMIAVADSVGPKVGGVLLLIFGPIVARIYAEILIVVFRINDHLRHIQQNTQRA